MLEELGRIHKIRNMQTVMHQSRLNDIRAQLGRGGMIGARDASEPTDDESVSLPSPEDDVFSTEDEDPFKV
jgi:hypothetical protein